MTLVTKRDRRIRRLAGVLCVEWVSGQTWVDKYDGRWWLVGCPGGDHPLPNTGGCHTVDDALDAAEAWLAPQIDLPECSICRRRHGPEVVHACE